MLSAACWGYPEESEKEAHMLWWETSRYKQWSEHKEWGAGYSGAGGESAQCFLSQVKFNLSFEVGVLDEDEGRGMWQMLGKFLKP